MADQMPPQETQAQAPVPDQSAPQDPSPDEGVGLEKALTDVKTSMDSLGAALDGQVPPELMQSLQSLQDQYKMFVQELAKLDGQGEQVPEAMPQPAGGLADVNSRGKGQPV